MKMDVPRGARLGCLGSLCFSVVPLLLALTVAVTMGSSTRDSGGSRALGLGVLLFFVGNGSIAAFVTLGVLAATDGAAGRGRAAGVGGIAGALFTVALTTSPAFARAWLLPALSAVLVLAVWAGWRFVRSRSRA